MMLKRSYLMLMIFAMVVGFTSCSDDDDGNAQPIIDPTGSLVLGDNPYEDGTVTVSSVTMSDNGWLVVYGDDDGLMGTDVLGSTEVDEGTTSNVSINLDNSTQIQDGDVLWVALHTEVDDDNIFDWDGFDGDDEPITDGTVAVVESFVVDLPSMENSITVEDQTATDNMITLNNVTLGESGWVVVHADNEGSPGAISATPVFLEAGSHNDVEVTFNEDVELNTGDSFWAMLHSDTGVVGEFEFDGENGLDLPIIGDDDMPVMETFTITE